MCNIYLIIVKFNEKESNHLSVKANQGGWEPDGRVNGEADFGEALLNKLE